jgi:antitoxin component of MazEF toxin-antitoxin module
LPHKDSRKIIKLGNSYAVTLPKKWAEYFGVREKDNVQVISNGVVIIKPQKINRENDYGIEPK